MMPQVDGDSIVNESMTSVTVAADSQSRRTSRPAPADSPGLVRELAGRLHREIRLAFTPIVKPEKWVFIVGCYNSGTELLSSLLGSHREVAALPVEGQFLTRQFKPDYELGLPRMWALREDLFRLTEQDAGPNVRRLHREWLMRLDRSRPVFLEKSPPNAARTRWLQANFHNAHFVALVRNGYAVAEGIRRKAEPRHLENGWPLDLCARQWNRSYQIMLEDAAHLRHVCWTRYEDLAANPGAEMTRIFEFLGLDPAGASEIQADRSWAVHEKDEPIRDMNAESISRLTAEELAVVTREAEPMLRHFGYPLLP